jgi:SAM-dependent methyltransferase
MTQLTRRTRCRLCDGGHLDCVLPLCASPIADAYVPAERLSEPQPTYPLDLYLCRSCGHVQNLDVVDPELLFRDYGYVTASSSGLVEHYRQYAREVADRTGLRAGDLVVDIGSNDGSLLDFFKSEGARVLGVDPASRIAAIATARGITTVPEFFTSQLAAEIRRDHGPARVVVANNVFAHADDLADIVTGVRGLLAEGGVFVFEVSYLPDIVDRFMFDTVYHEHVSYHSIVPLQRFFARLGMQLFDVERIASKGGSIRALAQCSPEGSAPVTARVVDLARMEAERGFGEPAVYAEYARQIQARKAAVLESIDEFRSKGQSVAGFGASTTVTTLLWQFDLTQRIDFLADDNPRKSGLFAPRCHIPVLSADSLYTRRPAAVVVLAWNYADAIIERHRAYRAQGGRFIVPLPHLIVC